MLINDLKSIIAILNEFIKVTNQDIQDIQEAQHEILFKRNDKKEKLLKEFNDYKHSIDQELVTRSQTRGMDDLLDETEGEYLDVFKEKLSEFGELHKRFSKMVFSVNHFYTNLMHKITESETQIGYEVKPSQLAPTLHLKG